jgi:hypothetical protein
LGLLTLWAMSITVRAAPVFDCGCFDPLIVRACDVIDATVLPHKIASVAQSAC